MPRRASLKRLTAIVKSLVKEREQLRERVTALDSLFEGWGTPAIAVEMPRARVGRPPGRRGRKPGRKPGRLAGQKPGRKPGPKPRGKFAMSGKDSILAFVKSAGQKGVTGSDIVKHWESQGRGAGAYVNLGELVKAKKLKRRKIRGGRGSRYAAA